MHAISRRQWVLSAMIASLSTPTMYAQPPTSDLRIAASMLPVDSRSVRLTNGRGTRTVVTAVVADPRGELLVAAGDDHAIRVMQAATMKVLHTLTGHRDLIRTLAFEPKGNRLVSAGNDGQLILWNREDSFKIEKNWSRTPAVARVCFSPDGQQIAAVGFDRTVFLIGGTKGSDTNFDCDCNDLRGVAYRDDMQVLAVAGRCGSVHLFDPKSGDLLHQRPLHRGRITDIAFRRDSNVILCVGEDGFATVFDSETHALIHEIPVTTSKLFAVTVIDRQLAAVAGSDNVIRIIDADAGKVVRTLQGHSGSVSTLDSRGGWLFSGSFDATLRRWAVVDLTRTEQRIAEGDQAIER